MSRNLHDDLEKLADAFYKHLEITPWEYGGIGLDPKRPFGNSDVISDMCRILKMNTVEVDGEKQYLDKDKNYVDNLYKNKLIPYLQIRWKERTHTTELAARYVKELNNKSAKLNNIAKRMLQDIFEGLDKPGRQLVTSLVDLANHWKDLKESE